MSFRGSNLRSAWEAADNNPIRGRCLGWGFRMPAGADNWWEILKQLTDTMLPE